MLAANMTRPTVMTLNQAGFSKDQKSLKSNDAEPGKLTLQQRLMNAQALIERVQRKDNISYMCNDSVPIDLEGTYVLPVLPERKLVTEYLDSKHVDREFLQSHLFSMLQDFFVALSANDYAKMHQLGETRFVNKLKEAREEAGS